jgi:hypothetical protein
MSHVREGTSMGATIRSVEYFYAVVEDRPGAAYRLLASMASSGVNLLAFNAIPLGMDKTQLVLFPEDAPRLARVAEQEGLSLAGPQYAFLIQGDDHLGALVDIHRQLFDARVNVVCSSGVTDDRGGFGYLLYVRHEEFTHAAQVLGV